jgi:5'-methylthioadenosine phosphorylase
MAKQVIGIIGGSGLYEFDGLENVKEVKIETPFGLPSDAYMVGDYEDRTLAFLPRHGRGHRFSPSELNFLANIHGFLQLGAKWVISVSAVGSMREDLPPGKMVLVDQFFDHTKGRDSTFYGNGVVGHVGFGDPICGHLSAELAAAAESKNISAEKGGTYICIEGPQFSTRAESEIYRKWGVDVIGMTNVPEAKLAREAGLCYATMAMVTDYDCWHEEEEDVTVAGVLETLKENVEHAKQVIAAAAMRIPAERSCGCLQAARSAVMTPPESMNPETRKRLRWILGEEK